MAAPAPPPQPSIQYGQPASALAPKPRYTELQTGEGIWQQALSEPIAAPLA